MMVLTDISGVGVHNQLPKTQETLVIAQKFLITDFI
jgi:hypothetical protein